MKLLKTTNQILNFGGIVFQNFPKAWIKLNVYFEKID